MCTKRETSMGHSATDDQQPKASSRTLPPRQLTEAEASQVLGAHMRLARIRLGYSVQELSRLSGVSARAIEAFEVGSSGELQVVLSVRIGFILRDALGPMLLDGEFFRDVGDMQSTFPVPGHGAPAERTH